MMFSQAIVRPPAQTFAKGLTTAGLGLPDFALALTQHEAYCQVLEQCGLDLIHLRANPNFPDSTFVEDTAILTEKGAIFTRPGAPSRLGEVTSIASIVEPFFEELALIKAPGTVDGGDVCEADGHFFIGLSERTNAAGAEQLARWLNKLGYTSQCVDIRGTAGLLHLKSGLSYLGQKRLVVVAALAEHEAFQRYEKIIPPPQENYAANCIRVNEHVLLPNGFPVLEATIRGLGDHTLTLDMSEFQKMDGGLSCLSLRF